MDIVPNLKLGTWAEPTDKATIQTLSEVQQRALNAVLKKFPDLLTNSIGRTNVVEHGIDTNAIPIKQRYYPVNPKTQEIFNRELDKMITDGIVEPSNSPWSSPALLIKKKDNTYRFVVDYRRLNAVTKKDAYPLPYVNAILDKLRDARYLTSLDLKSAYWQIPVAQKSKELTAFTVPGRGLYHFNRMPFGLHNSPATWQRLMDKLFGATLEPYVFVYLDDIILVTSTFEKHLEILEHICCKLRDAGLTVNKDKCQFCRAELKYLGYVVDKTGLHVDPDKVSAILKIPTPQSVSDIRRFIGVASWYRRFIPCYSSTLAPLTKLLRKNQKWSWDDDCEKSFNHVKNKLVCAPILTCPDYNLPFYVQTDASGYGLGAVLTQKLNDDEKIICYASRTLNRAERNYTTTERECLAVIFAIEKFRPYLENIHFTVVTDHYSLLWLNKLKDPIGRLARWALRLQQFDFNIIHRKGKDHLLPDLLSRSPESKVNLITMANPIKDAWYRNVRDSVKARPESFSNWKVVREVLYRLVRNSEGYAWRLVVPKEQRVEVLRECHDRPTAGHLGVFKTYHRCNAVYYWPKMKSDVINYVRRCSICQAQKPLQKLPAGLMGKHPEVSQPWQMISLDFMEFPKSTRGHAYLLVITDYFSKYVLLFPLRTATADKLCEIVEQKIFLVYGVCQVLLCDNGRQMISKQFTTLTDKYKVKVLFNPLYHAQCNPTERTNRTIKTMIRSYLKDDHRQWDAHLSELACAINTAKHEITQCTPHFLNHGKQLVLSGDSYGPNNEITFVPAVDRTPIPANHHLADTFTEVRNRLQRAYLRNKKYYDLRRRPDEFLVGELVWRKNHVLSDGTRHFSNKLAPKFVGPYKVRKKLSATTYELETTHGTPAGRWHVMDLKQANE